MAPVGEGRLKLVNKECWRKDGHLRKFSDRTSSGNMFPSNVLDTLSRKSKKERPHGWGPHGKGRAPMGPPWVGGAPITSKLYEDNMKIKKKKNIFHNKRS